MFVRVLSHLHDCGSAISVFNRAISAPDSGRQLPIFRYSLGSCSLKRSATKFSFCLKPIVPIMAMLAAALFVQFIGASGDIAVGRPDFASVRARNRIACSTRYKGLKCEDPERKDERGRLCIACIGKYV